MQTWRTITAVLIVATILAVACYDLVAYVRVGNEATISRICLETANNYRGFAIGVVFLLGILCGHLFLPQHVQP
jgi:hypothetical protein